MTNSTPDISSIIKQKNIVAFFQPIISIKQKTLVGLEALCRGIDITNGELIPPAILFEQAEKSKLTVALDRLCREKAFESFKNLPENKELLLAINFKTSIIDQGIVGSNYLLNQVEKMNLSPSNIVIEIVESEVNDTHALSKFIHHYKNCGFLIALDDFGTGYSNLDRISLIKPDIIKIDRSLIVNFSHEYYKQEMFKSLVSLSHKLGALVLAEGIESEQEAILAQELGIDMLQGYYFSQPSVIHGNIKHRYDRLINDIAIKFKKVIWDKIDERKLCNHNYEMMLNHFMLQLSTVAPENFDQKLTALIAVYSNVECIYILDQSGIQVTNTICDHHKYADSKKFIFTPAQKGSDQSLKDYYLLIHSGSNKYITDPYISLATGNSCVTISAVFDHISNHKFILCLDIHSS